jgi:CheY-like chemotaxis protein
MPRVVVLDSDAAFTALMSEVLGDEGFRTVAPADDDDPLEAIVESRADLAVVDPHRLNDEEAPAFLSRLRSDPRLGELPVLVCSGDIQHLRELAPQLSRISHVALLEKPFRLDALSGALHGLLAGASPLPQGAGTVDPEATEALEAWIGRLGRSLRWAVVDAWVPDRRPGLLRCAAAWVAAVQLQPFADVSLRTRLPAGGGLPGRIWVSGRAAWIEDLSSDMNFPRLPTARRVRLVSAAAVPVIDHHEVVGVVACYDTRLRAPDPTALDRLRRGVADAGPMLRSLSGPMVDP